VVGGLPLSLLVIVLISAPASYVPRRPTPAPSTVEGPRAGRQIRRDSARRRTDREILWPYKEIALGIWETTYQGKNLTVIRVRIAAAEDGVFFIVPLFAREQSSR
jgi:hypothetical protein